MKMTKGIYIYILIYCKSVYIKVIISGRGNIYIISGVLAKK